jgi:hypothetical protein
VIDNTKYKINREIKKKLETPEERRAAYAADEATAFRIRKGTRRKAASTIEDPRYQPPFTDLMAIM